MNDLLVDLNSAQRYAVTHSGHPLLVLAGPGSGKTRIITRRIAWSAINRDVEPDNILAITFTNRAATEMKERMSALVGDASSFRIGTFHWMCGTLLRQHAHHLNRKRDFRVLRSSEARYALQSALHAYPAIDRKLVPRLAAAVSALKNGAEEQRIVERFGFPFSHLQSIMAHYDEALIRANAVDVDDLIYLVMRLLQQRGEVLQVVQSTFAEILVDEYQDINPVQHEVLTLLAGKNGSIVAVGDDDQAIYSWREADSSTILRFPNDFPHAETVKIEQTYRCTKHILRAATSLIDHNQDRFAKKLSTIKPAGEITICFAADDEVEEAEWIAETIQQNVEARKFSCEETALLYRVNAQSRALEDALVRHGLPYHIHAGNRFYEQPHIRRVVDYLRLVLDPGDDDAAARLALSVPGVGPRRVGMLKEEAARSNLPVTDIFLHAEALPGIPGQVVERLKELVTRLRNVQASRTGSFDRVVDLALETVSQDLEESGVPGLEAAQEDLQEFRSVVREFNVKRATLRSFLDRLALDTHTEKPGQGVTLMSLHAAKGLEFRVVFLCGLEEGLLPHRRALDRRETIDEERRLCYVGMTRAQDTLHLSYAHARSMGGQLSLEHPSRFIAEMGSSNVHFESSRKRASRPRLYTVAVGDRVTHTRWGSGTVVKVEGAGRETLVTINFDDVDEQRLQLCYAPLQRESGNGVNVLAG